MVGAGYFSTADPKTLTFIEGQLKSMLSEMFRLLPTVILVQVYNAAIENLKRRGCLCLCDTENEVSMSQYKLCTIKVEAIRNESYTCIHSIYFGDILLCEGGDSCFTMGQSKTQAREWIDNQEALVDGSLKMLKRELNLE